MRGFFVTAAGVRLVIDCAAWLFLNTNPIAWHWGHVQSMRLARCRH